MPIKDPYFATLKSNNYLPNALVALDAQLEGFDQVCIRSVLDIEVLSVGMLAVSIASGLISRDAYTGGICGPRRVCCRGLSDEHWHDHP